MDARKCLRSRAGFNFKKITRKQIRPTKKNVNWQIHPTELEIVVGCFLLSWVYLLFTLGCCVPLRKLTRQICLTINKMHLFIYMYMYAPPRSKSLRTIHKTINSRYTYLYINQIHPCLDLRPPFGILVHSDLEFAGLGSQML